MAKTERGKEKERKKKKETIPHPPLNLSPLKGFHCQVYISSHIYMYRITDPPL